MAKLNKTTTKQINDVIKSLKRLYASGERLDELRRVAFDNLMAAACDALMADTEAAGCYLQDWRNSPRTEFKGGDVATFRHNAPEIYAVWDLDDGIIPERNLAGVFGCRKDAEAFIMASADDRPDGYTYEITAETFGQF